MKPAVELAVRVVADQVVRAQVVDDARETAREIVGVDDREAVGRVRERAQRLETRPQARGIDARRHDRRRARRRQPRRRPGDRLVEDDETAWIDGIERGVRRVCLVQQQTERRLVVDAREVHAIALAGIRIRPVEPGRRRPAGQLAGPWIDADLRRRDLAIQFARELLVGLIQAPTVSDNDHRLALFAHAAEIGDHVVERVEGHLLVAPFDHLVGDAAIVVHRAVGALDRRPPRIAGLVLLLLRVGGDDAIAVAPVPVTREKTVDGRGLARKRDVLRRHLRRHHGHQIVGADQAIERVNERLADVVRALEGHVVGVQKQHQHPRARVLRRLAPLVDGVRLAPQVLRDAAANHHPLELLDFLEDAAFEHVEVGLREIGDRRTVFRGKDVDADVVRLGAEGRRRLRRGRRQLRGPAQAGHDHRGGDGESRRRECKSLSPQP